MAEPFSPCCPDCGRSFTLAELKHMAVGDGWQRHLRVNSDRGTEVVSFDEFAPATMVEAAAEVAT